MGKDIKAATVLAVCPDCGGFATDMDTHRNGWYYSSGCGRRFHLERETWEPMRPAACYARELEQVKQVVTDLCKLVLSGRIGVNVPEQKKTTLWFDDFTEQLDFTRARGIAATFLNAQPESEADIRGYSHLIGEQPKRKMIDILCDRLGYGFEERAAVYAEAQDQIAELYDLNKPSAGNAKRA